MSVLLRQSNPALLQLDCCQAVTILTRGERRRLEPKREPPPINFTLFPYGRWLGLRLFSHRQDSGIALLSESVNSSKRLPVTVRPSFENQNQLESRFLLGF